jgi:AcrR family transcriptional regulator
MSPRSSQTLDRQRTVTRQAILDAALAQVQDTPTAPFSHESVAARAGMAPRTVYRHFPTRGDLTAALWTRLRDAHGTRWPSTRRQLLPALRRTFRQFGDLEALTRAAIAAAATTQYPVHGSAEGREAFRRCLADLLDRLTPADGQVLIANCLAIYSAPYWQMLRDRGGLSQRDAERAGALAMQALVEAAEAQAR